MGSGSYIFCEWDSIQNGNRPYQQTLQKAEQATVNLCLRDWAPKGFNVQRALSPAAGDFGRTTILPEMFDGHAPVATPASGVQMAGTWRQLFTIQGNQILIQGSGASEVIPEDFKVAWVGLAFPNKQQHITEIKWQIGDRKYGRINIEEMHVYDTPALIFEEGFLLNEEESFHLYGYVEGPIPTHHDGYVALHQSIVMLGAAYFKVVSKVLGNPGAPI